MKEMGITKKLLEIVTRFNVKKENRNNFGGFNFRSAEQILAEVKPYLQELSCLLLLTDDVVHLGERYYIKAKALLIDIETGEELFATGYAREEEHKKGMDAAQITGSASSYARKRALEALFLLDNETDPDAISHRPEEKAKVNKAPKPLSKPKDVTKEKKVPDKTPNKDKIVRSVNKKSLAHKKIEELVEKYGKFFNKTEIMIYVYAMYNKVTSGLLIDYFEDIDNDLAQTTTSGLHKSFKKSISDFVLKMKKDIARFIKENYKQPVKDVIKDITGKEKLDADDTVALYWRLFIK